MGIIYVKAGKEIPGDSWVLWINASGDELQTQPISMTTTQMGRAGVTTIQEDPRPDDFYGPVAKDPANPGKWIQTLYTPAELKLKLEGYSSNLRLGYETGNIIIHPPTGGDYASSTTRDSRTILHNAFTYLKDGNAVGGTVTIKLMRVKTTNPPAYGNTLFVPSDLAKVTEVLNAINKWSDLCFATEKSLFDQIEAGTVTTKDPIDSAYLSMQTGAFPVSP